MKTFISKISSSVLFCINYKMSVIHILFLMCFEFGATFIDKNVKKKQIKIHSQ